MTLQTIRQLYELSTDEEALGLLADVIIFMRTKNAEYPHRSALEQPSSFPSIANYPLHQSLTLSCFRIS